MAPTTEPTDKAPESKDTPVELTLRQKLAQPFKVEDLEWRLAQSGLTEQGKPWGKCLTYVTARAVMERLDDIFGINGWDFMVTEFKATKANTTEKDRDGLMHEYLAAKGTLRVKIGEEAIIREDVCECSDIEAAKGAVSGALKRCAVQLGIGRYLYDLPKDQWAFFQDDGIYSAKIQGKWFKWNPPSLPDWALPTIIGKAPAAPVVTTQPPPPVVVPTKAPEATKAPVAPKVAPKPAPAVPAAVPKPAVVVTPTPVTDELGALVPEQNKKAFLLAFAKHKVDQKGLEMLLQAPYAEWRDAHRKRMLKVNQQLTVGKVSLADICTEAGCTLQADGSITEG